MQMVSGIAPVTVFTAGCVSTLPPPATMYSFDRRCQSVSVELRSLPVSASEKLQTQNAVVDKEAAVQLIHPPRFISLMSWNFCRCSIEWRDWRLGMRHP